VKRLRAMSTLYKARKVSSQRLRAQSFQGKAF
jgi:hypothetical protein